MTTASLSETSVSIYKTIKCLGLNVKLNTRIRKSEYDRSDVGKFSNVHAIKCSVEAMFLIIFLQLGGPATGVSRKILHDLTSARHFRRF
jgi:hypothetical protein